MKKTKLKDVTSTKKKPDKSRARKKTTVGYFFIPFLITVIALAVESCLIFNSKTGIVGAWIYNVFIGVFGIAGYFIPIGLLTIAFFFNGIVENKNTVYKCVTFAFFIFFLAALNSVFFFESLAQSPINVSDYFVKGYSGEGGGVVGGIVGKFMTVSFGGALSVILSVIVCVFSLSLFIGSTKAGIWFYLKETRNYGTKKTTAAKVFTKALENTHSKETEKSEPGLESKSEAEKCDIVKFNNTVDIPAVLNRPSDDPFRYGNELGANSPKKQVESVDLRIPKERNDVIKDIYSEELEKPIEKTGIKIVQPTVSVTSQNGRAYSPFATPFIKKEEFLINTEVKPESSKVVPPPIRSRAYSPFADPFTKREEFMRNGNGTDDTSVAVKVAENTRASASHTEGISVMQNQFLQEIGNGHAADKTDAYDFDNTVTIAQQISGRVQSAKNVNLPMDEHAEKMEIPEKEKDLPDSESSEVGMFGSEESTDSYKSESLSITPEKRKDAAIISNGSDNTAEDKAPWETPVKNASTSFIGDEYTEDADAEDDEDVEEEKQDSARAFNSPAFSTSSFANAYADRYNSEKQAMEQEAKETAETGAYRDHSEKFYPNYVYPSSVLLEQRSAETTVTEEDVIEVKNKLLGKLASFKIEASLVGYSAGPSITRYELAPGPGVTVKAITNRIEDIALELQSDGVRIATVPGKSVIGIEVPNKKVSVVSLRSLIENRDFMDARSKITVCVGLTVTGRPIYMDIDDMPHVLIAGQTKSGKSVAINCMLLSLLYRTTPDEVQLILIDPKRVELNIYSKVPHLVMPVIDDPQRAAAALRWAVAEMERRYEIMDNLGVRNRDEYYEMKAQDPSLEYLPQIVIVIDELADLMLQVREHVETLINRIAAKARACGIHLVVGTQRPSVDIVTGLIKANIPARVSFQVSSSADSRIILGAVGAEKLLGRGDMLYQATGAGRVRVQGAFVSSSEIKRVTQFIIENNGEANFDPEIMRQLDVETDKINKTNKKAPAEDSDSGSYVDSSEADFEYICKAMEYVFESGNTTTNNIQRRLRIGFNRAADIVDTLENLGFISRRNGSKPRDILIDPESFEQWRMRNAP